MKSPLRAVGVVINDDKILLMKRIKKGKHYYAFIGGGVNDSEEIAAAVEREVYEEASLKVRAERLLYKIIYDKPYKRRSGQIVYLCSYISGTPELGDGNEREIMSRTTNFYKPVWVDIAELPKMLAYPLEVRDWVIEDYQSGFISPVKEVRMKVEDLKRS